MVKYPILCGEIAIRSITKTEIARKTGLSQKALYNKLNGITPFTWNEACVIQEAFFPDKSKEELFAEAEQTDKEAG